MVRDLNNSNGFSLKVSLFILNEAFDAFDQVDSCFTKHVFNVK